MQHRQEKAYPTERKLGKQSKSSSLRDIVTQKLKNETVIKEFTHTSAEEKLEEVLSKKPQRFFLSVFCNKPNVWRKLNVNNIDV